LKRQNVGYFPFNHTLNTALLISLALLVWGHPLWALEIPALKGRVNDYANMLNPHTIRQLDAALADLEKTDSTQIVVLTIPSLKGDSLEDFSIRVSEAWGIGHKDMDNGAVLLIAKNDRKLRIEVGYGLEGVLTDLISGRIIRNVITPQFKMGHFDQGVLDGIGAMIGTVKGEYTAPDKPRRGSGKKGNGSPGFMAIVILFFIINVVARVNRYMGAAIGGLLVPIVAAMFINLSFLAILAFIPLGIVGGLLMGIFSSPLSFGHTVGYGGSRTYWGGGGGGFSSGGFSGFSGGGGGFGGGGASGGW
jgi:uncharacterized protein